MKMILILFIIVSCGQNPEVMGTNTNKELMDIITELENRVTEQGAVQLDILNSVPIETINPCGDNGFQYEEVLLRMNNGDIIAFFEQNETRFLTLMKEGSYITTDNEKCNFTLEMIDGRLEITNEV